MDEHLSSNASSERARQLRFLEGLLASNATVAGDVVAVSDQAWAIYGFIPVDGDVIMAEFTERSDAEAMLDQLYRQRAAPLEPDSQATEPGHLPTRNRDFLPEAESG